MKWTFLKTTGNTFLFALLLLFFFSCNQQRRLEREAIKKQEAVLAKKNERSAQRMADYELAMQQHYDNQTKKTQRMMRKTYQKAERQKFNKREPFYVRWFKNTFGHQTKTKRRKATK